MFTNILLNDESIPNTSYHLRPNVNSNSFTRWAFQTNIIIHDTLEGTGASWLRKIYGICAINKTRTWYTHMVKPIDSMNSMSCN